MIVTSRSEIKLVSFIESLPRGKNKISNFVRSVRQGVYRWDPWLFQDGDIYRLFYLEAPKPKPPTDFWSQGTIYGAISHNLTDWEPLGVMLAPNPKNPWESGRLLAGSIYKERETYYLFYSASGGGELLKDERIGLATSKDGVHWERFSSDYFFSESEWGEWYGRQPNTGHFHWRDPYIVKDESTGQYYMYVCAFSKTTSASQYQGCVGLAIANQITGPYKLLPPVASPEISGMSNYPFTEMERPQVIYHDKKYYLFFSCWTWNLNPLWLKRLGSYPIRDSSVYWFVADSLTGPFKAVGNPPIVKGSEKTGLYATNFFSSQQPQGKFSAIGWYHRIYTLQTAPRFALRFKPDEIELLSSSVSPAFE